MKREFRLKPTGFLLKVLGILSNVPLFLIIISTFLSTALPENSFFKSVYTLFEQNFIYILAIILVTTILYKYLTYFGKKQEKSYKIDKETFPNKYRLLDDTYQDDVFVNGIGYSKVDLYKSDYIYAILKKDDFNLVAVYNQETDELSVCDDLKKHEIVNAYRSSIPNESFYRASVVKHYFLSLYAGFLVLISFGLLMPYVLCMNNRFVSSNTYINGERLVFSGKALQLFGKFLLWWVLTIITLGLYGIWLTISVKKWTIKHTHFRNVRQGTSNFDGSTFGYVLRLFGFILVSFLTLGIGSFWAHCAMQKYLAAHTVIDGVRLKFTGTAMQYFGKRIMWLFFTVITFGIYSLWLTIKTKQWTVKHTKFDNPSDKDVIMGIFTK